MMMHKEMTLFTLLVKSEKYGKICLGCVDENKRWIRPIKPGGFVEGDIRMDNGKLITLFDVFDTKFSGPFPINHHKENMLFVPGTRIKFVKKLSENERDILLSEIADNRILNTVRTREELFNELSVNLNQSLVLAGPINLFDIQYYTGDNHPRIWIVRQKDKNRVFSVRCTNIRFCKFVKSKLADFKENERVISQDVSELKDRQIYFVIGLTGDSLEENNKIKDGKYAPPGSSRQPSYWPMIVSVLTVPDYSIED